MDHPLFDAGHLNRLLTRKNQYTSIVQQNKGSKELHGVTQKTMKIRPSKVTFLVCPETSGPD